MVASGVLGAVSATVVVSIAWQKFLFLLSCFGSLELITRRIFPATTFTMVGLGHISSVYRHSLRCSTATIPSGGTSLSNVTSMCDPGQIDVHVDGDKERVPGCGEHDTETWCPGLFVCYS